MMRSLTIGFTALLVFLLGGGAVAQDRYIKLTADQVPIRFAPTATAQLVATGRAGDVFELAGEKQGWFEIYMFSGESRFVIKSSAQLTAYKLLLPASIAVRRQIFRALVKTETRSTEEANLKYPLAGTKSARLVDKHIEYMRVLDEQYKLAVMHQFNVQTPIYADLAIEGSRAGWR